MIYLTQYSSEEVWYFEVNEEGTVFRQMLLKEGKEGKVSNQRKFQFFLSETNLMLDDRDYKSISKEEFEQVWDILNRNIKDIWIEKKRELPIGTKIDGYIEVFYPQGVIVSIPLYDVLGIANYEECQANSKKSNIHKDLMIKAEIIGYDEVNFWFVLGNPEVLENEYLFE